MKKSILCIAIGLAISTFTWAGGSSQGVSPDLGSIIPFSPALRVKIFEHIRSTIDSDGRILVCESQFLQEYRTPTLCTDANGKNAWKLLETSAPYGYRVDSFEYRFAGSGGYPRLIVYYLPK